MHADAQLAAAIAAVPELGPAPPRITPIHEGRTNRNFRVDVGGEAFFLRLSDEATKLLGIDRGTEHQAALAAAAAGVGPEVIAFLPELGCMVTRWVPGEPLGDGALDDDTILMDAIRVVRTIHAGPELPWSFSAFRVVEEYAALAAARDVHVPRAYDDAHARAARIEDAFVRAPLPLRPCHNDLLAPNFLRRGNQVWLVDYEYAGMGDPFFDLGNLSINNGLSEDAQERLLIHYLGEPSPGDRARLKLMRIMSDFREAMWGVVQQGLSTLDIDYVEYATIHFERLAATMADDRFEDWLGAVTGA